MYSVVTSALRARGRRRRDRRGRTGRIVAIVRRLGGGEGLRWWGWVSNKWIGREQWRIAAIKCLDGPFGVEDSRTDFGSHELRVRLSARFQPSFFETSQCTTYPCFLNHWETKKFPQAPPPRKPKIENS